MRLRAALPIVTGLLQVGCYNYLPLRRSSLVPSSYLAVTLTESGSEELAPYLGPNALVVRGRYLAATDRGLALAVDAVESRRGDIARWAGETVVVPGEFVRAVEQRQVARSKVVLLTGVAVAGFVVAYQAFGPASGGGLGGGGGSGPGPR
jgi:hypothetical protein